jgi:hypothetical protein
MGRYAQHIQEQVDKLLDTKIVEVLLALFRIFIFVLIWIQFQAAQATFQPQVLEIWHRFALLTDLNNSVITEPLTGGRRLKLSN